MVEFKFGAVEASTAVNKNLAKAFATPMTYEKLPTTEMAKAIKHSKSAGAGGRWLIPSEGEAINLSNISVVGFGCGYINAQGVQKDTSYIILDVEGEPKYILFNQKTIAALQSINAIVKTKAALEPTDVKFNITMVRNKPVIVAAMAETESDASVVKLSTVTGDDWKSLKAKLGVNSKAEAKGKTHEGVEYI